LNFIKQKSIIHSKN